MTRCRASILGGLFVFCSLSFQSAFSAVPAKKTGAQQNAGEREIYQELSVAYEQNDLTLFQEKHSRLEKGFPASIYLDDAEYMLGMMFAGRKDYGMALKTFNEALAKYPSSNRLRTLLLSKATTLKRMNLSELAQKQFEQVKRRFPGSPEALRADVELKLISR